LEAIKKRAENALLLREQSNEAVAEQCCGLAAGTEHLQILICGGTGCKASASHVIAEKLQQALEKNKITDQVNVITTGCFGFCEKGPIVKIIPDNTFYTQVTPEDAEEIVSEHIIGGRKIERLLYVDPKTEKTVSDSKHMDFYRKQMRIALRNCGFIDPEKIDFDNLLAEGSMMGSGGMIVMDEDDCMVSVARFYLDFTVEESCGKCTPCRIGNKRLLEILNKITDGRGTEKDLQTLSTLGQVIKDTALCGLGQTSPNPVLSTLNNFYDEYVEHVRDKTCRARQCKSLLTYTINPELCIGCHLCFKHCPADAILGDVRKPHVINPDKCIKCGMCMARCKFKAISVC